MRPITPQPGYLVSDTEDLLASDQFIFADCFKIALVDGSHKYYYTTAQYNVSVVPLDNPMRVLYLADSVQVQGLRFSIGVGVEVDEQEVTLAYHEDDLILNVPFSEALKRGYLDGASIHRDRFFAANWDSPFVGGIPMFYGKVSSLSSVGRVEAKVKVKSDLVLLDIDMPKHLWQASCLNTWGDSNCGVDQNAYATHYILTVDGTPTFIPWPAASSAVTQGKVYVVDGFSVTHVRSIRNIIPGVGLQLSYPLPFSPVFGNDVVIYPGCGRTTDGTPGCKTYWGGTDFVDHFRAYPFVPVAETAV
jgi:hypothetical protein